MPVVTLRWEGSLVKEPSGFYCPLGPGDELLVVFPVLEGSTHRYDWPNKPAAPITDLDHTISREKAQGSCEPPGRSSKKGKRNAKPKPSIRRVKHLTKIRPATRLQPAAAAAMTASPAVQWNRSQPSETTSGQMDSQAERAEHRRPPSPPPRKRATQPVRPAEAPLPPRLTLRHPPRHPRHGHITHHPPLQIPWSKGTPLAAARNQFLLPHQPPRSMNPRRARHPSFPLSRKVERKQPTRSLPHPSQAGQLDWVKQRNRALLTTAHPLLRSLLHRVRTQHERGSYQLPPSLNHTWWRHTLRPLDPSAPKSDTNQKTKNNHRGTQMRIFLRRPLKWPQT
ncbi:hypothetical protein HPB51_007646 [Rhipicephalus microplus]|uniref:Uncharacterized protein n=1 Tax=Rhipicephalus microplus TaxID=6941 RepID=A0A9J6EG62_RHIMP|nr:hypothetical protein HPB51_007646 [Rhipicephalus microplus]